LLAKCLESGASTGGTGFVPTILLVEPTQPFLGTVHLDKLPYENVDLTRYYPYGNPALPG
jgi:hypothetical protein